MAQTTRILPSRSSKLRLLSSLEFRRNYFYVELCMWPRVWVRARLKNLPNGKMERSIVLLCPQWSETMLFPFLLYYESLVFYPFASVDSFNKTGREWKLEIGTGRAAHPVSTCMHPFLSLSRSFPLSILLWQPSCSSEKRKILYPQSIYYVLPRGIRRNTRITKRR